MFKETLRIKPICAPALELLRRWPDDAFLPVSERDMLVLLSNKISLRFLVGGQLVREGERMGNPATGSNGDSEQQFINGFIETGRAIMRAQRYFKNGQSQVELEFAAISVKLDKNWRNLQIALEAEMAIATRSLCIDPKGIDFLTGELKRRRIISESEYNLSEDPFISGMRHGINRYSRLYSALEYGGARPDSAIIVRRAHAIAMRGLLRLLGRIL